MDNLLCANLITIFHLNPISVCSENSDSNSVETEQLYSITQHDKFVFSEYF